MDGKNVLVIPLIVSEAAFGHNGHKLHRDCENIIMTQNAKEPTREIVPPSKSYFFLSTNFKPLRLRCCCNARIDVHYVRTLTGCLKMCMASGYRKPLRLQPSDHCEYFINYGSCSSKIYLCEVRFAKKQQHSGPIQ